MFAVIAVIFAVIAVCILFSFKRARDYLKVCSQTTFNKLFTELLFALSKSIFQLLQFVCGEYLFLSHSAGMSFTQARKTISYDL